MRTYLTTLGSLAAVGVMLSAFSSCGSDTPKTTHGSSAGATDPDLAAAKAALASAPLGRVISRDARGAGRLVVASPVASAARLNLGHETVARLHFERHAAALGLNNAAVQRAVFTGWHALPAGAGLAQFEQRIGDVEVFRARASIVVDGSNQLVSIASSFPGAVKASKRTTTFRMSAEAALASAYTVHAGVPLGAAAVRDLGQIGATSMRNYAVDSAHGALRVLSATAKAVFFPTGDRLEPGYYVEILGRAAGSSVDDARSYVIAAEDGRALYQSSLTMNDAFNYRVWADPAGRHVPADGPITDMTPHPTGLPDRTPQTFTAPIMVAMEGFNKNLNGAADPWLDPAATFTWGNNALAYSDRNQAAGVDGGPSTGGGFQDAGPDGGGGDYRAELTSPKTFDRIYDVTKNPDASPDQIKASITQLFYTNNWLHDFWYDSGFNELAGNAQASNYGRGGVEGDPLRLEAQDSADSGQANNANMSTQADGSPPRMQMFVWTGLPNRNLEVTGATLTDPLGASGFGPQTFDITGTAVLSDDGSTVVPTGGTGPGTVNDACQVPTNVMGKIAVIDRGVCSFIVKVGNAQMGGATGIILANNAVGNVPPNPGGAFTTTVPLIGVSLEDGTRIKAVLGTMPMAHLKRGVEITRDGTLDNSIVAHEFGHYWHHRLVSCGSASCGGMSEGWGDFLALMMTIRDADRFDTGQTYAVAQYATQGVAKDGSYFGIRRAPYSRDMAKNPFTFQHVRKASTLPTTAPLAPTGSDMSEVHNVGEIWTQTLFEAYTNLLDVGRTATPPRSFDETQRRMADYLVAGLKATPAEPTFVEQRDAILLAVYATKRMDDFAALAKGFAKRGLGAAAVAPPTSSTVLDEAVEDFSFKGNLDLVEATLDDSVMSCDKDGKLDANEIGKLTVKVRNSGWVTLTKSQVTASSTDPNVTFGTATIIPTATGDGGAGDGGGTGDGGTVTMGAIEPYGTTTVTINVTAKEGLAKKSVLPISINLADSEAAKPSADVAFQTRVNFDETAGASATDDVESTSPPVWQMTHTPMLPVGAWSRELQGDMFNHVWHAEDLASPSDEALVSPDLKVGMDAFTISFSHRFLFESRTTAGVTDNFDGGVLELSEDAGATWKDISDYADPMYTGKIFTAAPAPDDNVLGGRQGWVAKSGSYPMNTDVKLDLGMKVAGKTVKVRFRAGTDEGNSSPAAGWDIDNIAFGGITNKPFVAIVDNSGVCSGDGGMPTDGGAKDGSTGTGGSGGSGGSTGGTTPPAESDCSCSVPGGHSGSGAAAVGVFGALAMVLRRRRQRR